MTKFLKNSRTRFQKNFSDYKTAKNILIGYHEFFMYILMIVLELTGDTLLVTTQF